jgi:hypothetical protein
MEQAEIGTANGRDWHGNRLLSRAYASFVEPASVPIVVWGGRSGTRGVERNYGSRPDRSS